MDNIRVINKGLSDKQDCLQLHRAKVGCGGGQVLNIPMVIERSSMLM